MILISHRRRDDSHFLRLIDHVEGEGVTATKVSSLARLDCRIMRVVDGA
jgi:hypothetical protein